MDSNYNDCINSLMREYGKDEGSRAYFEEASEFMKGVISNRNEGLDLFVDWLMKPNHDIRTTQKIGGTAITLIIGKYDFCELPIDLDITSVEMYMSFVRGEALTRKTKIAKMNAAKETAKAAKAKREEAKMEEEKKDAPMKKMVNGFKNKISSLEIAIYSRDNIITKKDDEIVALKERIASLALEIEQVRNENGELAIYKELVEGYMNDAA